MKVLITTYWYDPTVNGVVTSVMNLKRAVEEEGHDVRVLTLRQKRLGQSQNVYMIPSVGFELIYPEARLRLPISKQMYQEIIDWKPDVVHSQCELLTFRPSIKIARKQNIPLIHTYHTHFEEYTAYFSPSKRFGDFLAKIMTKHWLKYVDHVIVPTIKMKRIIENYGVTKPISIIPTGIDLSRFENENNSADKQRLRKELNLPEEAFIILSFGRLAKEKNITELLSYVQEIKESNVIFVVAGTGPESETLLAQAEKMQLGDRVCFRIGRFEKEQVPKYYQAADLFVSASISETQGLTFLEALSSGTLVLCRKDECLEELIINGKNGYQYETKEEFLSFLSKMIKEPETREQMAVEGKKSAKEYSLKRFGQRVSDIYQREGKKI